MSVPTMRRNVLVYLAGPITAKGGRTLIGNIADGVGVYLHLLSIGIPCFLPHLCGLIPGHDTVSYETYLAYDRAILDRCTHVLMLPGWQQSTGAQQEYDYAMTLGSIRICHSIADLRLAVEVPNHSFKV